MSLPKPTQYELAERQNSYEAGYLIGLVEERERIIKLLEEHLPKTLHLAYQVCVDETGTYDANEAVFVKNYLIAFIKEQNK